MSDVARQAGVSRATASYVLNRTPGARIPEQTRAKVLAAAEALRYVPHVSARSLRRGRSDLVVGHVDGSSIMSDRLPFFGLVRIASEVRKAGYTFLIHGDPTVSGLAAARAWLALRPAAVVATLDRFTEESVAMLAEAGTVPVALGRRSSELTATVVFDDGELGRVAVTRLADRGCRRIAVLGSYDDRAADLVLGNRIAEVLATAAERGLEARYVPMRPEVDAATRRRRDRRARPGRRDRDGRRPVLRPAPPAPDLGRRRPLRRRHPARRGRPLGDRGAVGPGARGAPLPRPRGGAGQRLTDPSGCRRSPPTGQGSPGRTRPLS